MSKITRVKARQVFDSRGNPTIEAEVFSKQLSCKAICPSGAKQEYRRLHSLVLRFRPYSSDAFSWSSSSFLVVVDIPLIHRSSILLIFSISRHNSLLTFDPAL